MKFFFRKKWKRGKTYAEKLPWVTIQSDLLEVRLGGHRSSRTDTPSAEEGGGGGGGAGWWARVCLLRLLQFVLLLATLTVVVNFLASALLASPSTRPRPLLFPVSDSALPHAPAATLLDIDDFELVHEAESACRPERLFFVLLVHSRPDHFRHRQAIRATWGGARDLGEGWATRTVFLLGQGSGGEGVMPDTPAFDVEGVVAKESERHGDLVVGSFVDHYHNLTYKHVMALRWAAQRCAHAVFLVKVDDDAFVDVPALWGLLGRTFSLPPPRRTLACNALPEGTRPQREGKWAVSRNAYPWPEYPRYCAGLAYVVTPMVADLLARAAQAEIAPRVWVDDVWVTGLLAEALDLSPHFLNLRYSYDHDELVQWVAMAPRPAAPPPYIFVHMDATRADWRSTLDALWSHALAAYNATLAASTTTAPLPMAR